MTLRRRTLTRLWATCDGTCGLRVPVDGDETIMTTEDELTDVIDMYRWRTVVRLGQTFHYCPECAQLLCRTCERFVGPDDSPECVFCAVAQGGQWQPRTLALPGTSVVVSDHRVGVRPVSATGGAQAVELMVDLEGANAVYGGDVGKQEPIRDGFVDTHSWTWRAGCGWGAGFAAAVVVWLLVAWVLTGWTLW